MLLHAYYIIYTYIIHTHIFLNITCSVFIMLLVWMTFGTEPFGLFFCAPTISHASVSPQLPVRLCIGFHPGGLFLVSLTCLLVASCVAHIWAVVLVGPCICHF